MTSPSLLTVAMAALLLAPKTPSGTSDSPDDAAGAKKDPVTKARGKGNAKGKGKGKGEGNAKGKGKGTAGPDQQGLATPPAGLHFVYVTPSDLVGSSSEWVIRSEGGLGLRVPSGEHSFTGGGAQLRLPHGARLRWLDCAINATGGARNSITVHARLARYRYDEHPRDAGYIRLLGQLDLSNTRTLAAGDQGRTFGAGVEIPASPDSLAADDGWFDLQIFVSDTEASGNTLRACRVGYEPS